MKRSIFKRLFFSFGIFIATTGLLSAGTLTCSVTTAGACTGVVVLRMEASTNAHSELPSQSNAAYANNVICCSGVASLGNSCSGTYKTVVNLASTTNSHVQQNTLSTYTNSACLSAPSSGYVTIAYKSSNCNGYDTTLGSMSSADNAHMGSSTAYTTKICGSADSTPLPQTISFSISTTTAYFGALSAFSTRYASSTNSNGDSSEVQAHSVSVTTNAPSGYIVNVMGQTLTYGTKVIPAIGGTNVAPSIGTEQFGLRATTTSGSGVVTSPYDGTGFAYAATATTSSQVAGGVGDSLATVYSFRYMANIGTLTAGGQYTVNLVYVATANF